jgi:hypothetical protein
MSGRVKTILGVLFIVIAFAIAGGQDRANWADNPTVTQSMAEDAR